MTINERVSDATIDGILSGVIEGVEPATHEVAMAREIQQYRAAEPVAYVFKHPAGKLFWSLTDESNKDQHDVMPVYAAPQVTSVPEQVPESLKERLLTICDLVEDNDEYCQDIWNACRTAMLSDGAFTDEGTIAAPAVQADPLSVTDAEHVASVLEMIGSFEPDDIDSDSVDLRFELDGLDTGSDVSITEYATRGAAIIRQLSGNTEQVSQPYTLPECFERLFKHAQGLTFGDDWNRGTAAKYHRDSLIKAVDDCRAAIASGNSPAIKDGSNLVPNDVAFEKWWEDEKYDEKLRNVQGVIFNRVKNAAFMAFAAGRNGYCAVLASGNSPAIPDGYALVPVEPTDLMVEAMYRHPLSMRGALKEAIEAAPKQESK